MKEFFNDKNIKSLSIIILGGLVFFLFTQSFVAIADIKIRAKVANASSVLTFRGSAEIEAKPDIVSFNITIRESEKDVAVAQQKMTEKSNKLLALLKEKSVEKKDIQTAGYSTNPRYNYEGEKQVLQGYEASQTIVVKLRDVAKSGEVLSGISALEIAEVNGPIFAVDDEDKLRLEAQAQAIIKAKAEAKITAKNLGIKLGRIVRFNEELNHNFVKPMMMARGVVSSEAMDPVQIEPGSKKVSSVVFVTYEIE
ncbi:MAG: SIMPL domain-containing protein [Proteobacteria bacterium]|nr:SIMPL domain-containing protein [Pseudomonadota bacterium]